MRSPCWVHGAATAACSPRVVEQAGHHQQALAHHRRQHVLVGRVLRARRVRMRHPHRGQAQDLGEHVVGQRAAEVGQQGGTLAGGLLDRMHCEANPVVVGVQACGRHHDRLADRDVGEARCCKCACTCARRSVASVPTTKRSCRVARASWGIALTGCAALPTPMASTLDRVPTKHPFGRRQPGSPQSASMAGSSGPPPTSISASARFTDTGIGGGRSASIVMRPRASTRLAMACDTTVPGLRRSPPQLPE